jgi:hypothetical protein
MVIGAPYRFAPVILLGACGGGSALAPSGRHPIQHQEYITVEFPPPPAQIEEIPEQLSDQSECVWVDGYWHWRGRWVWIPGRWVMAPEGCYRAPAVVEWGKTREPRLNYSPPRWYREGAEFLPANRAICPMPRACTGTASAGVAEQ